MDAVVILCVALVLTFLKLKETEEIKVKTKSEEDTVVDVNRVGKVNDMFFRDEEAFTKLTKQLLK